MHFMHCWKTINVKKEYGFNRLFTFAVLAGMGVFTIFYVLLNFFYTTPLSDRYFFFFFLGILSVYPLHKMFHFLPLIGSRKCLKFILRKQLGMLPGISLHVKEPVAKTRFLLALLAPFILLNTLVILLSALFPAYIHYFAILLAYHCSLCLTDLVYVRHLLRTPKHALIEETETGFEILVPQAIS
ncbi:DUF3267 domain-containing protein [Planococcus halotolerans]|uniref:DUF3267 domain-containing protein n=1 Tax=Planococcus halotolerans TaxID=2233542 RepID=UPI003F7B0CBA